MMRDERPPWPLPVLSALSVKKFRLEHTTFLVFHLLTTPEQGVPVTRLPHTMGKGAGGGGAV